MRLDCTRLALLAAVALILGCGEKAAAPDPTPAGGTPHAAHTEKGPHGGHVVELGSEAHFEFVHDATTGVVTMHFTGADATTPLVLDHPPELKLMTDSGPLVVRTRPVGATTSSSQFTAQDPALATEHPIGRISIKIGDKVYNPDLESTHPHD